MLSLANLCILLGLCVSIASWKNESDLHDHVDKSPLSSVTFLVSVNDTWNPKGCLATIKTPPLLPDRQYNETKTIEVGDCDRGPLVFSVTESKGNLDLFLTFYSSVIEDASPPTCHITWNGTYLLPTSHVAANQSLLPGCYTAESREGYHMTYYWFYVFDWQTN